MPTINPYDLARRGGVLEGSNSVLEFERLEAALAEDAEIEEPVTWRAQFAPFPGEDHDAGLTLSVSARLPLSCVRCLSPVQVPIEFERAFRLVADESQAALLDEQAEDHDVLAVGRHFDLLALVEDELIMALPLMPRHAQCPPAADVPMPADVYD
ncbi:MAG: DUF177 domain-containing protein, partial [Burkholderiaceae bacterium]